jgi:hypothetical protein
VVYVRVELNDNTVDAMKKHFCLILAALAACTLPTLAQMGAPSTPGLNAALTKLFGSTTAFSARCEVSVLDKNQKEKMGMPMDYALLDGKLRVEVDMTAIKGAGVNADQAAMMKQMGMNRIISLVLPDKKTLNLIYPAMQAYVTMPLSKDDAAVLEKEPKIEKAALGKETVDGHPCEKNKITITDANGKKSEVVVWNASDLKDFPVKVQAQEKGDTVLMRYKNIQFAKPDAKQFDLPTGYTVHTSMEAFMGAIMAKMMGGAVNN